MLSAYQLSFESGEQDALALLARWRRGGWKSKEECRQFCLVQAKTELAHAKEQAGLSGNTRSGVLWQEHIAFLQGQVAALSR